MDALETERLLLVRWESRHRDAFRLICADPDAMRHIGRGSTWDAARADEVFDGMLAHWDAHGFGWRSVLERATGAWLGFVGVNYAGPGKGVAPEEVEIGWWIVRRAWGRGYATEGAVAARDEAFGHLGLRRLIARLQPANVASAHVAERIGLRLESEATGAHGEPIRVYAQSRADWRSASAV